MDTVELLPVRERETADQWHSVVAAAHRHDHQDFPADPVCELWALIQHAWPAERTEAWLACRDGQPVGAGVIESPLMDNRDTASVGVYVHPAVRRQGVGRHIAQALLRVVRRDGRRRVLGEVWDSLEPSQLCPSPSTGFALALGAAPRLAEIRRSLDLITLNRAQIRQLASRQDADYLPVSWVGAVPDQHARDAAALLGRMSTDAPFEQLAWQAEVWDAQRYLSRLEQTAARGRALLATAICHRPSGRLVAYTDIGVSTTEPEIGFQWDTIVAPAHRGHRLGIWLKAVNLELLAEHSPLTRALNTWNAASNGPMVAVNDELGYRPIDRWWEYELALP